MYTTTDGREMIADFGDHQVKLHEDDPMIAKLFSWIKTKYPQAAIRLNEQYDTPYEMTLRFLKCNFAVKDNIPDIIGDQWNTEFVSCPLRGECQDENVICNPELDCGISIREKHILKHIAEGKHAHTIGEELFISTQTVETHRKNMQERLGIHTTAGLVSFAYENKIV